MRSMADSKRGRAIKRLVDDHPALFTFGLCGAAGVLVDVDHILALLIWRYWNPTFWNGRFLHTPILVGACLVIITCGAYWGGLHIRLVLMG